MKIFKKALCIDMDEEKGFSIRLWLKDDHPAVRIYKNGKLIKHNKWNNYTIVVEGKPKQQKKKMNDTTKNIISFFLILIIISAFLGIILDIQ